MKVLILIPIFIGVILLIVKSILHRATLNTLDREVKPDTIKDVTTPSAEINAFTRKVELYLQNKYPDYDGFEYSSDINTPYLNRVFGVTIFRKNSSTKHTLLESQDVLQFFRMWSLTQELTHIRKQLAESTLANVSVMVSNETVYTVVAELEKEGYVCEIGDMGELSTTLMVNKQYTQPQEEVYE